MAVCKGPNCRQGGSDKIFAAAKEQVAKAGLGGRCEVYRGGCYGLCHTGPNVVLREDNGRPRDPFSREDYQLMGWEGEFHYHQMTPEKMQQVVDQHLAKDAPVNELLAAPDDTTPIKPD